MIENTCKSVLLGLAIIFSALSPLSAQQDEPCGIYNSTVRTFGMTPDQIEQLSAASHQLEMETKAANNGGAQRAELLTIPIVFKLINNFL